MNSHLPNMRLLTIPSEQRGEDWFVLSQKLDQMLEGLSLDLAEEVVYLIFSESPEIILDGRGQCLVARSVIGPKKAPASPLGLIDWKASEVWIEKLAATTLEEALTDASEAFYKVDRGRPGSNKAFFIKLERRLKPDLELWMYAIFHE